MNHELKNGQAALEKARERDGINEPQRAASILEQLVIDKSNGKAPRYFDDNKRGRVVKPTRLDELDISHHVLLADAVKMARAWAEKKRNGVQDASCVLCGPVGTGKTHIAKSILWSVYYSDESGHPVAPVGDFFVARDLMESLSTPDDWAVIRSRLGKSPIIVIDDVGSEGVLSYVKQTDETQADERQARYFRVIDYCYTWQISLIITSNLSIPALLAHVGKRAADRLSQMAPKGFVVDLTGVPSWRQKKSGR